MGGKEGYEWELASEIALDGRVLSVAFSPDSRLLASGSQSLPADTGYTNAVVLWDVASAKEIRRIGDLKDWVTWVSFSPDGRLFAWGSGDHTMHLLEVSSWKELACLEGYGGYTFSASFSPDSQVIASGHEYGWISLWDIHSGKEIKRLRRVDKVGSWEGAHWSVAFSPDGKMLASGFMTIGKDHADQITGLILWDFASGTEIKSLEGHTLFISSVSFSPDGKFLATGSYDKTVRLWKVSSRAEVACFKGHEGTVDCVTFSVDGQSLVSGSGDKTIRIWDVSAKKELQRLALSYEAVSSVAFSPDGQLLAVGALERRIRILKLQPTAEWFFNVFKERNRVDAGLLDGLVRRYRDKGKLEELANGLNAHGFFEEAAKIYDDLGHAPKKSKSESTQRPKESKPTSREADSTKSVCPSCDAEVKAIWLECPECGASLKETACKNCGERLEPHWERCPACRTDVAQSK